MKNILYIEICAFHKQYVFHHYNYLNNIVVYYCKLRIACL